MKTTCIILPIHNEEANIQLIVTSIQQVIEQNYVLLLVDDGSTDTSLSIIEKLALRDLRIKCLSLSRNFGHQNAIMAGLQHAEGDYFITMDCDGQHPVSMIPQMIGKLDEGFDIVNTCRTKTENIGWIKKYCSKLFYVVVNSISDVEIKPNQADFRAFNKKVLNSILQFKETELFLRGIFSWVGFKNTSINFNAPARLHGKTKYSFKKMVKLALKGITSFSYKPLRVALLIGTIISSISFAFGIYALVAYFKGETVHGWPSLIISIMFLGGTQLLTIGLLGEYIAGIFSEVKKRPIYLTNRKINMD